MKIAELSFESVCRLADLPTNRPVAAVGTAGEAICLVRDAAGVHAFVDSCPHRGHPISEGVCDSGVLRCALHGWEFEIQSGAATSPAAPFGLRSLPVRVLGGMVQVGGAS